MDSRQRSQNIETSGDDVAARVEAGVAGADEIIGLVEGDGAPVDCHACVNPFGRSGVLEVADTEDDFGDLGAGGLAR